MDKIDLLESIVWNRITTKSSNELLSFVEYAVKHSRKFVAGIHFDVWLGHQQDYGIGWFIEINITDEEDKLGIDGFKEKMLNG